MAGKPERVTEVYNTLGTGEYTAAGAGVIQLSTAVYEIAQVIIGADADNSNEVYVGNAASQVFKVEPGASLTIPINRLDAVYVRFIGADTIFWLSMRDS